MDEYDIELVRAARHADYWIPADKLEDLNATIVGHIDAIAGLAG